MLALAGRVSPRSIDANEPVACIYEIIKYCGMEMKKRNEQAPDERKVRRNPPIRTPLRLWSARSPGSSKA
jgi:hypothetical protein